MKMTQSRKRWKISSRRHRFQRSGDRSVCPVRWPEYYKVRFRSDFSKKLAAQARRALPGSRIFSLTHLAQHAEGELLRLHGIGPRAVELLKKAWRERGLSFAGHK